MTDCLYSTQGIPLSKALVLFHRVSIPEALTPLPIPLFIPKGLQRTCGVTNAAVVVSHRRITCKTSSCHKYEQALVCPLFHRKQASNLAYTD